MKAPTEVYNEHAASAGSGFGGATGVLEPAHVNALVKLLDERRITLTMEVLNRIKAVQASVQSRNPQPATHS
jgi:hypothetical protein